MKSCELILALDIESREEARKLLNDIGSDLKWVKIGLQMFTANGPDWVKEVANMGFNIFLDLKLHDIPNTVAKTVQSLSQLPIGMLTIHSSGCVEMMRAAESETGTKTRPSFTRRNRAYLDGRNSTSASWRSNHPTRSSPQLGECCSRIRS